MRQAGNFFFPCQPVPPPPPPNHTSQEVFSEFDSWGDGRIRYADFDRMMATTT